MEKDFKLVVIKHLEACGLEIDFKKGNNNNTTTNNNTNNINNNNNKNQTLIKKEQPVSTNIEPINTNESKPQETIVENKTIPITEPLDYTMTKLESMKPAKIQKTQNHETDMASPFKVPNPVDSKIYKTKKLISTVRNNNVVSVMPQIKRQEPEEKKLNYLYMRQMKPKIPKLDGQVLSPYEIINARNNKIAFAQGEALKMMMLNQSLMHSYNNNYFNSLMQMGYSAEHINVTQANPNPMDDPMWRPW